MAKFDIGAMVNAPMPPNDEGAILVWPGIVVTGEQTRKATVIDRNTALPVEIDVVTVDVLTLRTNREGGSYTKVSTETVNYGFRVGLKPRFRAIVGLDAREDGTVITLAEAMEEHEASNAEFLRTQSEVTVAATSADDL